MKLRIAIFNLENLDDKPDQKPTLQERIAVMRPQLQRINADILCLQKVNGHEEVGKPRSLLALDALLKDINMPILRGYLLLTRIILRFTMSVTSVS